MLGEGRAEFMEEEGLFSTGFEMEGGIQEKEAQKVADLAVDEASADKSNEDSSVNGMTNAVVQTGADEFVIVF